METKFTKGNWRQCCPDTTPHYVFAGEDKTICRILNNYPEHFAYEKMEGVVTDDECRANAKLIAAAPDLLAALSELHDLAMDGYDSHVKSGTHEEFLKEDREVLKNALKAIKKAIE